MDRDLNNALQQIHRTYVKWGGRKLSYFSGCDYFRLSSHPQILRAVRMGLKDYGLNVAASRLTTGNHRVYDELEAAAARFFKAETALLVATGYVTNLAVAQALSGQFSHVLIDRLAHTSLKDAAQLLGCPILEFEHRSALGLKTAIKRTGPAAKLILLTDGLFARDGSVAPLDEYDKTLPQDALMLVDDAHGAGILGEHGGGTLEHTQVNRRRIVQTVTLSKAFGTYGGLILCSARLRKRIIQASNLFVGSTPLPLPLANAGLRAMALLKDNESFRPRLKRNTDLVVSALLENGVPIPRNPGPIISFQASSAASTKRLAKALLNAGIFPPFIQYPGSPSAGYFRFVISSEHTREQLTTLSHALARTARLFSPLGLD